MAVPLDILNDLASVLSIGIDGSRTVQPGQPLTAKIVPPVSDLRAADILSVPATLTWITKNLVFATGQTGLQGEPLATNLPNITGPMPIADVTRALTALPGIPGLLGQLDALVPMALQVPVGLRVAWSIKDGAGNVVAQGGNTYYASGDLGQFDPMTSTFMALGTPEVSFVFVPQTVELTTDLQLTTVTYTVNATVQLFVGNVASTAIDLPPIPIIVPAIPIPFIATFFRHSDFQAWSGRDEGFALIMVPSNSPLRGVAQFQDVLTLLQTTVGTLQQFANFASLVVGLGLIADNIAAQPYIVLKALDEIKNLADVQVKDISWTDWRGINANDEISSVIVLGPENHTVQCDNETDSDDDEGQFTVTIGPELYVTVPNLEIDSNAKTMTSVPAGRIQVDKMPSSYVTAATFNDELSSVSLHR
jgi:hypothetical protein